MCSLYWRYYNNYSEHVHELLSFSPMMRDKLTSLKVATIEANLYHLMILACGHMRAHCLTGESSQRAGENHHSIITLVCRLKRLST